MKKEMNDPKNKLSVTLLLMNFIRNKLFILVTTGLFYHLHLSQFITPPGAVEMNE